MKTIINPTRYGELWPPRPKSKDTQSQSNANIHNPSNGHPQAFCAFPTALAILVDALDALIA
jgi:hypothetical protein